MLRHLRSTCLVILLFVLVFNIYQHYSQREIQEKSFRSKIPPTEEDIPIITGSNGYKYVDQLPKFWQKDHPWTVGFVGSSCPIAEFLILIKTAPKNVNAREVLRQYFDKLKQLNIDIDYRFLFGFNTEALLKECGKRGDAIYGSFPDSYSNLPLKTKVGYEYFSSCVNKPKYILFSDDDTWVNPLQMRKTLKKSSGENRIFGRIRKGEPRGPWAHEKNLLTNTTIWKPDYWPAWVAGPCTFMRGTTAQKISEVASRTNWLESIPPEDVFFSGILRLKAGIPVPYETTEFDDLKFCKHLANDIGSLKQLTNFSKL